MPLTSYPGMEYQATFSPDGSHVAFVWCRNGNHDIYVQPVGVLKPSPLAEEPELEHSPAWSPDGRWIAFIRDPTEAQGRARVLVKPPFAGRERLVTEYVGRQDQRIWQRQIAWTPDSRHLVLSRPDDDGATWSLYLVDVRSGEVRRLTESPARDSAPAVSPDGRSLAFSRRVGVKGEIHLLPLGRDFTPADHPRPLVGEGLLREVPLDASYMPAWTHDGREIVFAAFPRGPRLFRVNASGAPRVRRIPASGGPGARPGPLPPDRTAGVHELGDRAEHRAPGDRSRLGRSGHSRLLQLDAERRPSPLLPRWADGGLHVDPARAARDLAEPPRRIGSAAADPAGRGARLVRESTPGLRTGSGSPTRRSAPNRRIST